MKIAQVIEVEPHFMQPLNARRYTDLPWEVIQEGIDCGLVKTFWLRNPMRRQSKRGILLIERASLIAFIEGAAQGFIENQLKTEMASAKPYHGVEEAPAQ